MKKALLIFIGVMLFAKNIYLYSPKTNKTATIVDEKNKIISYIQKVTQINLKKIKPTFENAKKMLCKNQEVKKHLHKGYVIEFIYVGDKNTVIMRFTNCN